jgi:tetratricopeptide (TPR) repeat protein
MLRTLIAVLAASTAAHAGLSFTYTHSTSDTSLVLHFHVGGYGSAILPVPIRTYGGPIHGRWPTPGNRFLATTEDVWFYNPYDPPSYRWFGLVYLDAEGKVTGVTEWPKSGRGFDFDLTILQREAALRDKGLGRGEAEARKARRAAIEAGLSFLRDRNYTDAQTALKNAVWVDPDDGPAQMLYGAALLAAGDWVPASKALRRGLASMTDFKRDWARMADLFPDRVERDRIAAAVEARMRPEPENPHLRFLHGWVLLSSGDAARAADVWKQLPDDEHRKRLLELAAE